MDAARVRQRDLVERTGISAGYLSYVLSGKRNPSTRMLRDLAAALRVSADWLATGKGEMRTAVAPRAPRPGRGGIAVGEEEPLTWEAALDPVVAGTPLKVQRLHARGGGLDADRAWREMSEEQRDEIRSYLRRAVAVALAIEHVLPPKSAQAVIDALSTEVALVLDTKIRDSA